MLLFDCKFLKHVEIQTSVYGFSLLFFPFALFLLSFLLFLLFENLIFFTIQAERSFVFLHVTV